MGESTTMTWLSDAPTAVLHCLFDATLFVSLLIATSAIVFRFTRTMSASTRHFALLLALVSPVLLPVFASVLPHWHVLPSEFAPILPLDQQTLEASTANVILDAPPVLSDAYIAGPSSAWAVSTAVEPRAAIAGLICAAWIIGVLVSLTRWGMGVISLWMLRRQSTSCARGELDQVLLSAMARMGVSREVRLMSSDRRSMPMQWGTLRPTILLPSEVMHWSRETIETVLLHELAHVRRCDCLARGVALLTRSLFWFNPLVWWAVHRLRRECERACDDLLLTTGSDACDYADTLLLVTRSARESDRMMFAAMGMSTRSELEQRIRGILEGKQSRRGMSGGVAWLLSGGFSCVLCSTAVLRSQGEEADAGRVLSPSLSVVGHVDDSAEGRRSIAGSGHAVKFDRPRTAKRVAAIEIFASRYGTVDPPDEDFHVYLLDEKQQLIAAYPIAYSQIARGAERWYTLPITACKVPEEFYVAVAFNPHRTKGIYLGYDESVKRSHSSIGRPTTGFESVDEERDWMIRAVMVSQGPWANPFEESGP